MNTPSSAFPQVRVDELISAQVTRTPDAVAAVFGSRKLTYLELERDCDRVAARLRNLGVVRGSLVGIHLERSLEMLVVVIAVMKAGGAYVPLDPEFPAYRLADMVSDAGLDLVVVQSTGSETLPPGDYRKVAVGDLFAAASDASDLADVPHAPAAGADDLVYVLYTSGSTGKPKGVALEHRNVVNFLMSAQREPGMSTGDRLLAVATLSFDMATLDLFLPLISGATVVIASSQEARFGDSIRDLMETHDVTAMQATPTTWRLLIDAGWQGRPDFKVLCGGEPLPRDLAQMLLKRCGELWNLYGPTETAVYSAMYRVVDGDAPLLIGRPIANTRIYVLDRAGHPVPTGIPGELFIGGAGVARGYLNNPELTSQKFVPDPFWGGSEARMYRTGDSGRFQVDGNLEFRSRVDNQVKIRGFRVELGDVETTMETHPAVKQAIAKIFELGPGDTRLVAYVLPHGQAVEVSELRDHLRERLPRYMVPQHFVVLGAMPLLPNGKIDRKALPPPCENDAATAGPLHGVHGRDADPRVNYLIEVWSEILGVTANPESNFFDLGGHSMLAVQMVNRVAADTGVRLKLVRLASNDLAGIAADLPVERVSGSPAGRGAQIIRNAKRIFGSLEAR